MIHWYTNLIAQHVQREPTTRRYRWIYNIIRYNTIRHSYYPATVSMRFLTEKSNRCSSKLPFWFVSESPMLLMTPYIGMEVGLFSSSPRLEVNIEKHIHSSMDAEALIKFWRLINSSFPVSSELKVSDCDIKTSSQQFMKPWEWECDCYSFETDKRMADQ